MAKKRSFRISTLGSRLTSVISVALVLTVLGVLAMVGFASQSIGEEVKANMGFIVKMEPGASDVIIKNVRTRVTGAPYVERFVFSSPENILADEEEAMGESLGDLLDENPYGAEIDVKVRPDWASADSINTLAARLELLDGVEQVVTETAVVESVNSVLRRVGLVLMIVAAALLIISIVLITNTVSLSVYSRRFTIHTMKLVGATGGYIRAPFVRAGALTGVVAAAIAIALIGGLRSYLETLDTTAASLVSWPHMAIIAAGILAAGLLICTVASAMATNRYLRAGYDEMFRK